MSEDLTPQERLKRYKEYLRKLAQNEGRVLKCCVPEKSSDLKVTEKDKASIPRSETKSKPKGTMRRETSTMSSKSIPKDSGKTIESISEPTSESHRVRPTFKVKRDPNQFVSPAKRELREAGIDLPSKTPLVPEGTTPERKRVMLKVKQRSIESRLIQLKRERDTLERDFSRGRISDEYYRRSLTRIIKDSGELLKDKKQIEDEMKS